MFSKRELRIVSRRPSTVAVGNIGGRMNGNSLRSRTAFLLLAASLVSSLVLGLLFVAVHRMYDLRGLAAAPTPITDEQARQQVVEPGRQFVAAGDLKTVSGLYLLKSCTTEEKPPYQGALYLNFDVPPIAETPVYFRRIARAMTELGWREGLPPGRHPGGHTLVKNGLVAVFYRDPDRPGRGLLQIWGECRAMTDHRLDTTGFIDVTAELSR